MIHIKRIYDPPTTEDGFRVLIDRLWPRGISKVNAHLDAWLKDIAPTSELRTWFDHKPEKFDKFSHKYTDELRQNPAVQELRNHLAKHKTITLLYAAKDPAINHAVVLQKFLIDLVK